MNACIATEFYNWSLPVLRELLRLAGESESDGVLLASHVPIAVVPSVQVGEGA
jgi:hypothetical protein